MSEKIIHKRVTSTRLCDCFEYQLCAASTKNTNTMNWGQLMEWRHETKCHWKFVTCPICISMRGLPAFKRRFSALGGIRK